ncbi:helix-turn-helix domain-containing protein [Wielerella bovis]|uniref:helix-turn-helix domain-containing protein n=1 Tax=Wielerella bovis TaxID=2917790 RepID=UPI002019AF0D|nr:helix-turn-helix domain-containing protein [Wielerella bovis]ULJ59364.1 helix-turn-helix domain-containing protein [Wielerella bovis]
MAVTPPLSQAAFAKAIGISASTLKAWEQGTRKPSGAAETLLKLFHSQPEIMEKLIAQKIGKKTTK